MSWRMETSRADEPTVRSGSLRKSQAEGDMELRGGGGRVHQLWLWRTNLTAAGRDTGWAGSEQERREVHAQGETGRGQADQWRPEGLPRREKSWPWAARRSKGRSQYLATSCVLTGAGEVSLSIGVGFPMRRLLQGKEKREKPGEEGEAWRQA